MANVQQPSDFSSGRISLTWSGGVTSHINGFIKQKQKLIDSEVLRLCSPLVPFRTGALERSGTTGTVIGSGEVRYTVPYAREQYYGTAQTRSYDHRRGGKWFERMKVANKAQLQKLVNSK